MACGCGKARMARPSGASTTVSPTPSPNAQTRQTASAKVVSAASPYTRQQNVAPAHLQGSLRKTV